jgi:MFS family permease
MASRARSIDRPIALLPAMAFITQLGVSVMLPLLPLYAQSMGATPFVLSLLVGGFAIALAIGQLASGFLAERFPSRRLVVTGIGLYAGANVAIATAATAFQLIAFRAAAGLGSGINQVAERLYVTQVAERGRGWHSPTGSCRRQVPPDPFLGPPSGACWPRSATCGCRSSWSGHEPLRGDRRVVPAGARGEGVCLAWSGRVGRTTIEASWFALLSDATDGGRRGRAFGIIVALSSLGIVIGSTVTAQLWERSGDVGLGMLVAAATVAIAGLVLLAHPADRVTAEAGP